MNDIYLDIHAVAAERLEDMMTSLERRAASEPQRVALAAYLAEIPFPDGALAVDVGCGTGPQSRALACCPGVASVIGYDQTPAFVARARELAAGLDNLTFDVADAAALPLDDASVDVVVLHTVLSHVPDAVAAIAEAYRVLRRGGHIAVYDGDFSTMSVRIADADPLQACIDAFVEFQVNDRWLVRRLRPMLADAGFEPGPSRSHGHLETAEPLVTMGWALRGADYLVEAGRIGAGTADALKAELRARAEAGRYHGYMNFVSVIGAKPVS